MIEEWIKELTLSASKLSIKKIDKNKRTGESQIKSYSLYMSIIIEGKIAWPEQIVMWAKPIYFIIMLYFLQIMW